MVPISINGIGIKENVHLFFLSMIRIPAAASGALSWAAFAPARIYAFRRVLLCL